MDTLRRQSTKAVDLTNKSILVTGGTGSFGRKFVRLTLEQCNPKRIVVFSRDEMKQWEMKEEFASIDKNNRLRFFIGDVRDSERLHRAFHGVDYVVHAAALKIIPSAEYNPFECIKTNINGAMNVIDCALNQKVKKVVVLSTDKACNPVNLYGATKLCSDKLFVAANAYAASEPISFSVVRYGNVMGSRGSVIPFFTSLAKKREIPITDTRMTRFMISLEHGVELVWLALKEAVGGEIFIPKIPSIKITELAKIMAPKAKHKIVGIRPGEKIHEVLISEEDARNTYEYDWYYKILPSLYDWHRCKLRIGNGKKCPSQFSYTSENNSEWMTKDQLLAWLKKEKYVVNK